MSFYPTRQLCFGFIVIYTLILTKAWASPPRETTTIESIFLYIQSHTDSMQPALAYYRGKKVQLIGIEKQGTHTLVKVSYTDNKIVRIAFVIPSEIIFNRFEETAKLSLENKPTVKKSGFSIETVQPKFFLPEAPLTLNQPSLETGPARAVRKGGNPDDTEVTEINPNLKKPTVPKSSATDSNEEWDNSDSKQDYSNNNEDDDEDKIRPPKDSPDSRSKPQPSQPATTSSQLEPKPKAEKTFMDRIIDQPTIRAQQGRRWGAAKCLQNTCLFIQDGETFDWNRAEQLSTGELKNR